MLLVQSPGDGDWDGDRDRELLSARKGFLAGSALTVIVRGSGMLCEDASEDSSPNSNKCMMDPYKLC